MEEIKNQAGKKCNTLCLRDFSAPKTKVISFERVSQ